MIGYVYIVNDGKQWHARMSICPELDSLFWMTDVFGGEAGASRAAGRNGWLWKNALPLGDACRAAELWGMQRAGTTASWGEEEVLRTLRACVEQAIAEGEGIAGHSRQPPHEGTAALVERWEPGSLQHKDLLGWQGKAERLKGLAEGAERAAAALQGRALLRSEAHDLLGALGGPEPEAGWSALLQLAALLGRVRLGGSVAAAESGGRADAHGRRRRERSCLRCGSGEAQLARSACAACGRTCAYCTACMGMGRSRECELLVRAPLIGAKESQRELLPVMERLARWGLSPAQTAAAGAALSFVEEGTGSERRQFAASEGGISKGVRRLLRRAGHKSAIRLIPSFSGVSAQCVNPIGSQAKDTANSGAGGAEAYAKAVARQPSTVRQISSTNRAIRSFLLWAVTGAGKTEMVFPLIESALLRGERALIATPRRDVVIELDPRIRRAFPKAEVVTLYGGSEQRWERGDITLATTHQLMRFEGGFELVIVDEIDAYPYHGDPLLHYAADKSCAPGAARILLSATPPAELQRAALRGLLPHARVPVRYHRHPLPLPVLLRTPSVQQMLQQRKLPRPLLAALQQSWERGAQLFVFVQRIAQTEPMAELLRHLLRQSAVAATSSQDEERASKVQRFRSREVRVLVTTTILERGVTIPQSDVYIMDADGKLFDEASLVQMAGRAGRSADDPFGRVFFCSRERNQAQTDAVKHIRTMNKIARQQGFLL